MMDFLKRIAYKTTGFKSLFVIASLGLITLHDFSANNADIFMMLIGTVLGARAVQYAADAYKETKKGG